MHKRSFTVALLVLSVCVSVYGGGMLSVTPAEKRMDIGCEYRFETDSTGLLKWASSDTAVATVDTNGKVTAIGAGKAIITAKAGDGYEGKASIYVCGKGTITDLVFPSNIKSSYRNKGARMAVDGSGTLYLARNTYDEKLAEDSKAKTELWRYDGMWSTPAINPIGVTDDEASAPAVAAGPDGKVYILYHYYGQDDDLYDKNVVVECGTGKNILGRGKGRTMMVESEGIHGSTALALGDSLYVATVKSGNGYVHRYDRKSGSWKLLGNGMIDTEDFWAGGIDLFLHGGVPYASLRTSSGRGEMSVYYFDEGSSRWNLVGGRPATAPDQNARFQDESVGEAALAIIPSGKVFTAYKCYEQGESMIKVRVGVDKNSDWKTVYSAPDRTDAQQIGLVATNTNVYLIIAGYDKGMDIYKLNSCGKWVYEGRTPKPDTYYTFSAVAGINGEFYLTYDCSDMKERQTGVMKYSPYQFK